MIVSKHDESNDSDDDSADDEDGDDNGDDFHAKTSLLLSFSRPPSCS